ncbi:hypothetical protein JCM3775_005961 [Rhodotorula graminis]
MASPSALFASPLGSMHRQPPSQQATAARTILALLRRDKSSTSSPSSSTKKRSQPQLDCAIERSTKSTYTAYQVVDEASRSSSPPPPPYSAVAGKEARALALEEDLVVLDDGEEGSRTPASSFGQVEDKVETKQERKEREKRNKQERKRAQLVQDDRRIGDELARLGF